MRLRAEVRRSRVAQAGPVVSVGIGATRLRRPQSVTPPATDCGLAPALCPPPLRRIGLALELCPAATAFRPRFGDHDLCPDAALRCRPPRDGVPASPWSRPPCDGAPTSLWSCASATAYRHRSGAASPATAFRPRPGGHDLCPDAALRSCTPTGDHDSRPGATTLALASRPRFWAVFPPRCRDPRRPGGHDLCPGAVPSL